MVLVDTSVWVEVFRKPRHLDLESLVAFDDVVICLPVVQEVLQGFRDERAFHIARESLAAIPIVESPLRREVVEEAVEIYRSARRAGLTVRSSIDCLIAACAIRSRLELLHRDRDYDVIARVTPLRVRSIR